MFKNSDIFARLSLILGLAIFIFVLAAGALAMPVAETTMNSMSLSDEAKTDCPFYPGTSICDMSPVNHLETWRDIFLSLAPNLVFLVSIIAAMAVMRLVYKNHIFNQSLLRNFLYTKLKEAIYLYYRPLQFLYSKGILNPKLFNK